MVNLSHSSIMTPEGVCVCVWGGGGGGSGLILEFISTSVILIMN